MSQGLQAIQLLEECLKELESAKGSVSVAVQKLYRAALFLNEGDIVKWCEIQFGEHKYIVPLNEFLEIVRKEIEKAGGNVSANKLIDKKIAELEKLGLKPMHFSNEELTAKISESGGGYVNIGFVEEKYLDLVRTKRGNDGTYYKDNLNRHLNYVRQSTHKKATKLYHKYASLGAPATTFDILKTVVDDRLLDISPVLAEQLMAAFRRISTNSPEEWSQALTSCRRLLESLADKLYPPRDELVNGRSVNQPNYINRLWAYMDSSIKSDSNRELAKSHVDLLGKHLEKTYKVTNKAVHAEITRLESIKTVFHLYLTIADILEYVGETEEPTKKLLNINTASLEEIQSNLGVNDNVAKSIIKVRAGKGSITERDLATIKGIGEKTFEKAKKNFSFSPIS